MIIMIMYICFQLLNKILHHYFGKLYGRLLIGLKLVLTAFSAVRTDTIQQLLSKVCTACFLVNWKDVSQQADRKDSF